MNAVDTLQNAPTTFAFWRQFLEILEIEMQFIHAERDRDREPHLTEIARMLPYLTAADHPQYTRSLIQYQSDMRSLPQTFPDVHRKFMKGYFAVTHTRFTTTWSDQIPECTVNKDGKTTAGIIGEQMDERQTEAWILTLPISTAISNGFLQVVNVTAETLKHHEDNQSTTTRRRQKLQLSRDRVRDIFTTCGNPFRRVDFDLLSIVTSEVVDDEKIVSDITCVATKGKEMVEDFLCNRKDYVKKVALQTFPSERKTRKVMGVPRTNLLSSEITALKRIITAQLSYGEEKEKAVANILTKEILPFPPSIFEHLPQQSTNSSSGWKMRTGNKAVLLN